MTERSLTEVACFWGLSTDILYPSNCDSARKVEDKGCLKTTWKEIEVSSLDIKPCDSIIHNGLKPVRVVARMVYFFAVFSVIAPMGVCWHTSKIAFYVLKLRVFEVTGDEAKETWEKVDRLAWCALTDLTSALWGVTAVAIIRNPLIIINADDPRPGLGIAAAAIIPFVGAAFYPELLPEMIGYTKERVGMFQAIQSKNLFGITAKDGSLLSYSLEDDLNPSDPNSVKEHPIFDIALNSEISYLYKLAEIKEWLEGQGYQLHTSSYSTTNFPPYKKITQELLQFATKLHSAKAQELYLFIDKFKKLGVEHERALQLLNGARKVRSHDFLISLLSKGEGKVKDIQGLMPGNFYFTIGLKGKRKSPPSDDKWTSFIKSLQSQLSAGDLIPESFGMKKDYDAFKKRVQDNSKPHELFGLVRNPLEADVKKTYRRLTLALHPDKHTQNKEREIEAKALFTCLSEANEVLMAKPSR